MDAANERKYDHASLVAFELTKTYLYVTMTSVGYDNRRLSMEACIERADRRQAWFDTAECGPAVGPCALLKFGVPWGSGASHHAAVVHEYSDRIRHTTCVQHRLSLRYSYAAIIAQTSLSHLGTP